jgi:hypothetical protein
MMKGKVDENRTFLSPNTYHHEEGSNLRVEVKLDVEGTANGRASGGGL